MELQESKRVVNELLVEIFNDILKVEHKAIESIAGSALTMSEMHILEAVGKSPNQQMSDVAKRLRITLPTLTVSVQRLEEKGYITRRRTGDDRRRVVAELTERGKEAFIRHEAFHSRMVEALFTGLDLAQMPVLMGSMSLLRDFFKAQAEEFYKE